MTESCPYWKRGYCVADKACKFEHDPNNGGQLQETFLAQQKQQKQHQDSTISSHPAASRPGLIPHVATQYPVSAVSMASALYGGAQPMVYGYGYYGQVPPLAMMGVVGQPSGMPMSAQGSSNMIPKNYKTVQCRHFLRGHCMRGSSCGFRHGDDEGSSSAPDTVGNLPAELSNPLYPGRPFRVVTCRRWAQGSCTLGDRCTFKHDFDTTQHYQPRKEDVQPDQTIPPATGMKRQLSADKGTDENEGIREPSDAPVHHQPKVLKMSSE